MSFGLRISFGRLAKKEELPPFIIINHEDYFNVIHKDGRQTNEYETDSYIAGKDDQGFYMLDKEAIK